MSWPNWRIPRSVPSPGSESSASTSDDATAALLPGLRISSGVFVAARTLVSSGNEVPLLAGDVIHSVNSFAVRSIDGLRVLMDDVKANSELVLQIERNGRLLFVTCEIY